MTTVSVAEPPASSPHPSVQQRVRTLLWLFVAGALVFVVAETSTEVRRSRALENATRGSARQQAVKGAAYIDSQLGQIMQIVHALADDLSRGRLTEAEITPRLHADLVKSPLLHVVGLAYAPGESSAHLKRFAPHVGRIGEGDKIETFQLESRADYATYGWFQDGLKGANWSEPYFGAVASALVVSYQVPFSRPGDPAKRPIGVARITFSLEKVREMVSNISLGQTGYGFLASRNGTYLAYPDDDFVKRQLNVADVARQKHSDARMQVLEKALRGESAEMLSPSGQTGRLVWLVMEPVRTTGWVFGIDYFPDEVTLDSREIRRSYIRILGAVLLLLFAVSLIVAHAERVGSRELWTASLALGTVMLLGIATIWWLTIRYPDRNGEASVHILDDGGLRKFIAADLHASSSDAKPPLEIPTGLLVRTIRFVDANDAVVTGTLWQRIPLASKSSVTPGVEMPDAESLDLKKDASEVAADAELTTWSFRATLREPSEWAHKYPFDRALIRLRMIAPASPAPIVLVPDFDAYELLIPTELPGVDRALILAGWRLDHSYFSYVRQATRVSPAAPAYLAHLLHHDLAFNIVAERLFLDPFVSSVLPIFVIAALLFGLLVVVSKNNLKVSATGFKTTDILRAGVSLLFPALVAQVNLRSKIGASEVIYIEYFYFVLYIAILGVSANALTFTLARAGVSQLGDNLVPKLLFWPAFLGCCLAVTLAFLY
jgi:hypothetical protein